MKVYVLDPSNYTPYYDFGLCQALRDAGCSVRLGTSRFQYERLPFADDPCHEYRFFRWSGRLRRASLRRRAKGLEYAADLVRLAVHLGPHPPDVVHFQWLLAPNLELPLASWLRRRGSRLFHTVHNVQPHDGTPLSGTYYRALARHFDGLIVHSERDRRDLGNQLASSVPIQSIPHGVLFVEQRPPGRLAARRQLTLPERDHLILFFGLIERYKGVEHLAAALPAVCRALPGVKLVIAGKAGSGFPELRERLRQPEIAEQTILRTGFVPSDVVAAYFAAADLVVLPYLTATQSGVLMAAYRFGVPVVVTDTGALGATVAGDQTGLVIPPGDADALSEGIVELLSRPERREVMRRNELELAATSYAWSTIARQTIAVYGAGR